VASTQLAELLESSDYTGILYVGYPIIGTPDGAFPVDAMLLSPHLGVVIFNVIEGKDLDCLEELQDESYNKVFSKLIQHKALVKGKKLLVDINVVTFAPAVMNTDAVGSDEYPVANDKSLKKVLSQVESDNSGHYTTLLSIIQSISNIRKGKKRPETKNPDSRGSKIKALEDSIANLDNHQSAAVIETFDGVQRIRGLAGSGKTIVLALKVAYLHAKHPDWKIAITFNTRSLKGQFERLINTFVIEQTTEEPNWDNIHIIHAWGAPGNSKRDGIYYKFCKENQVAYFDFQSAQSKFGRGNEFDFACELAINSTEKSTELYDAILVDEAQDFSPHFLVLCYQLLKPPKRLIYAYDELQSLTSKSMPSPEEIFGKSQDGTPNVTFAPHKLGKPKQDIILEKCYRNSRPVLAAAHALGFGIYRQPEGLIQIFDQKQLWLDIGYRVKSGELDDGRQVVLYRTLETSPDFLEQHSPVDDLIQFHSFKNNDDQMAWLAAEIEKNLTHDELLPNDIIVINPDPLTTRKAVALPRKLLFDKKINTCVAGVSTSPDVFYEDDAVTFTGIFRAKGNEAAMVYVINAQDCFTSWRGELARVRNRLFTAITRSKAWVRVIGVGPHMAQLQAEFNRISQHQFTLDFQYPTKAQREQLYILNRDMTAEEKKRIDQKKLDLEGIIESLESGETVVADYPPAVIKKLKKLLGSQ
jgi:superfamily I DNA and RNA helicase